MVRRERRGTNARALLVAMLGLLLLASPAGLLPCYHGSAEPSTVLRIGFMQKVDSLNPNIGLTEASSFFYSLVYDSLQSVDEDMNLSPNLATSWWAVPGSDPALLASGEPYGAVWQYNLTRNARWHDGNQFTADDVVFTINMNCQNYDAMWAYQPYSHFMQNAEKIDNYTVRIHFYDRQTGDSVPVAFGDHLMIPILPVHMLVDMSAYDISFSWIGLFPDEDPPLIGTGPYMVTEDIWDEWLQGDTITLVANPTYHHWANGDEIPFVDTILLCFYDDATAMTLALERGDLDVAEYPVQTYASLEERIAEGTLKMVNAYDGPSCSGTLKYVRMNLGRTSLLSTLPYDSFVGDVAVRHALAMATNKSYAVDEMLQGYAEEGTTMVPPFNERWHYEPTESERFDLDFDAANDLLESAGYTDTDLDGIREATSSSYAVQQGYVEEGSPLALRMYVYVEDPLDRELALYLQDQWLEIGVGLYIMFSNTSVIPEYDPYAEDLMLLEQRCDLDPNGILFTQSKRAWNGWSDTHYFSPAYEMDYNGSVMAMDYDERRGHIEDCQRTHYLDAVYLVLAYPHQTYVWRNDTFSDNFWGDWAAHPGRSIDNIWGAHPLWFYEPSEPDQGWTLTTEQKAVILGVVAVVIAAEAVLIWRKYRRPAPPAGPD